MAARRAGQSRRILNCRAKRPYAVCAPNAAESPRAAVWQNKPPQGRLAGRRCFLTEARGKREFCMRPAISNGGGVFVPGKTMFFDEATAACRPRSAFPGCRAGLPCPQLQSPPRTPAGRSFRLMPFVVYRASKAPHMSLVLTDCLVDPVLFGCGTGGSTRAISFFDTLRRQVRPPPGSYAFANLTHTMSIPAKTAFLPPRRGMRTQPAGLFEQLAKRAEQLARQVLLPRFF